MESFAIELARAGFVGISVDYRLVPKDPFPAAVEDVKCAVRWMRAKAKEIGVDPERIAAAGTSAGGHLALMVGLAACRRSGLLRPPIPSLRAASVENPVLDVALPRLRRGFLRPSALASVSAPSRRPYSDRLLADEKAGLEGKGGHEGVSSRVQAVVSGFGPADLRGAVATRPEGAFASGKETEASPVTHATADDPPVLLLHGTEDMTVRFTQSEKMVEALTAAGGSATLVPARGAGHGYWRDPRWNVDVLATIQVWLERTLPAKP